MSWDGGGKGSWRWEGRGEAMQLSPRRAGQETLVCLCGSLQAPRRQHQAAWRAQTPGAYTEAPFLPHRLVGQAMQCGRATKGLNCMPQIRDWEKKHAWQISRLQDQVYIFRQVPLLPNLNSGRWEVGDGGG